MYFDSGREFNLFYKAAMTGPRFILSLILKAILISCSSFVTFHQCIHLPNNILDNYGISKILVESDFVLAALCGPEGSKRKMMSVYPEDPEAHPCLSLLSTSEGVV